MVCPYCLSKTKTANSRPASAGRSTWRRKLCPKCGAQFTTREHYDLSSIIKISGSNNSYYDLSRDGILLDISFSLQTANYKHEVELASILANRVVDRIIQIGSAVVEEKVVEQLIEAVLRAHCPAAATIYKARQI